MQALKITLCVCICVRMFMIFSTCLSQLTTVTTCSLAMVWLADQLNRTHTLKYGTTSIFFFLDDQLLHISVATSYETDILVCDNNYLWFLFLFKMLFYSLHNMYTYSYIFLMDCSTIIIVNRECK